MKLKKTDIEFRDGGIYIKMVSKKTAVHSVIKFPSQATYLLEKLKIPGKFLIPRISLFCFNRNIKKIGELAGWTNEVSKQRQRKGNFIDCKTIKNTEFRFCDQLSSHTMRRTAITLLLTLGVPELIVRKISGHSLNSKSFSRYVDLAQTYMNKETDSAFGKLLNK